MDDNSRARNELAKLMIEPLKIVPTIDIRNLAVWPLEATVLMGLGRVDQAKWFVDSAGYYVGSQAATPIVSIRKDALYRVAEAALRNGTGTFTTTTEPGFDFLHVDPRQIIEIWEDHDLVFDPVIHSYLPRQRPSLRKAGRGWVFRFEDVEYIEKDGKAVRVIAALLENERKDISAQDVEQMAGGQPRIPQIPIEAADPQTINDLKSRRSKLEDEAEEASELKNIERLQEVTKEVEEIDKQLGRNSNRHDKPRKNSGSDQRAVNAVRNHITRILDNMEIPHPSLATHLKESISIGEMCSYRPTIEQDWRI